MGDRTCLVTECLKKRFGRGLCQMHYTRWRNGRQDGLPALPTMRGLAVDEQFWSKVDAEGDCWLWTGATVRGGYGSFKDTVAHRWAFERLVGDIPLDREIDHLCRVRTCVNPDHLEAVTHEENMRRSSSNLCHRGKTHCPAGHPYAGGNLRFNSRGTRVCRICSAAASRRSRRKS